MPKQATKTARVDSAAIKLMGMGNPTIKQVGVNDRLFQHTPGLDAWRNMLRKEEPKPAWNLRGLSPVELGFFAATAMAASPGLIFMGEFTVRVGWTWLTGGDLNKL